LSGGGPQKGQAEGAQEDLRESEVLDSSETLSLKFDLDFPALYSDQGLEQLDQLFWLEFNQASPAAGAQASQVAPSAHLLTLARACETFIEKLFGLEKPLESYRRRDAAFTLLQTIKYKFVKRKAMLSVTTEDLLGYDPESARRRWLALGVINPATQHFDESVFAQYIQVWQESRDDVQAQNDLETARLYSAWACLDPRGQYQHRGQVLFDHAKGLDPEHLLHRLDSGDSYGQPAPARTKHRVIKIKAEFQEARRGFNLSDSGPQPARGLDQAKYCLICHSNKTDSCSHGMPGKDVERASTQMYSPPDAPKTLARNALDTTLGGCPLGEKISEFQLLRRESRPIAALAMITRDNPMVAATGHRICNDCSRACVFQQQTPVDIPAGETRILEDVLGLPWGVEIYSLLTRWNPLRSVDRESILGFSESKPRPDTGKKILVTGLGPAGFTLAHHLLNLGHQVVAIDGQKIEPLELELITQPIYSWKHFQESLCSRIPAGFGGVAEYGITVRWNKNYLKLIRLLLQRRPRFHLQGGVRLGSQVSIEQAFSLGFDHLGLALGAGKPKLWEQKNTLPQGVRMASDFLMALQLTGAYREDSLAALQIELPAVVIGAGLTAVDTATEALAYYALQVERFAERHRKLMAADLRPENTARDYLEALSPLDKARAERFIAHGETLIEEKKRAAIDGRPANLLQHLQAWGGVSLIYRRRLLDSPAYRLNHEELQKGLEEGIWVLEQTEVLEVLSDGTGALSGLRLRSGTSAQPEFALEAKTALIAIGADRNDFLRHSLSSLRPGSSAAAHSSDAAQAHQAEGFGIPGQERISILGDMHPNYAGSVVKAMASAARASTLIDGLLADSAQDQDNEPFEQFCVRLRRLWEAHLMDRTEFRQGIVELGLSAPAAAENFQPGQFFKLQNYEALQSRNKPSALQAAEPLAMTGATSNTQSGRLSTVILQDGASSTLTSDWGLGQEVVFMGPCGSPSEIPSQKKVLLVGGGLGNAVLFSIGAACRARACEVFYVAAYRSIKDLFHQEAIEAAADHVVWCFESLAEGAPQCRPQDQLITGNALHGVRQLKHDQILSRIEHLMVIGSDRMMGAVAQACRNEFSIDLHPELKAFASVNASMQCMMKGICGQCLQAIVDPISGQKSYVFACEAQDQPLLAVDFDQLKARLAQNRVLEVQHAAWLRHSSLTTNPSAESV
jgi:NADPH-dependent glutamate synthase beta subunit-like oxidoreductase/NAD(P)H-flavin reductase